MIPLDRRGAGPLRIGHRGAAALAPENTLALVPRGRRSGRRPRRVRRDARTARRLVVAHDPAHVGPDTPTLDEALRFFVRRGARDRRAPRSQADEMRGGGRRCRCTDTDLWGGASSAPYYLSQLRARSRRTSATCGRASRSRAGSSVSPRRVAALLSRVSACACSGGSRPILVRPAAALTRATDLVAHHSLITSGCVRAAHARGAAVVTWTVDDPDRLARVERPAWTQ